MKSVPRLLLVLIAVAACGTEPSTVGSQATAVDELEPTVPAIIFSTQTWDRSDSNTEWCSALNMWHTSEAYREYARRSRADFGVQGQGHSLDNHLREQMIALSSSTEAPLRSTALELAGFQSRFLLGDLDQGSFDDMRLLELQAPATCAGEGVFVAPWSSIVRELECSYPFDTDLADASLDCSRNYLPEVSNSLPRFTSFSDLFT